MNCHDFDSIACDLAREHLMDAAQREKALAHSASCAQCGSRLADERALTAGLRFVAKASDEQAPPRVEAALLAAFRQQRPVPLAHSRFTTRRWLYAAASAAAIALIVTLLALTASRTRDAQKPEPRTAANSGAVVPDAPGPMSPTEQASPNPEKRDVAAGATERRRKSRGRNRNIPSAPESDGPAPTAEIATDFIPLMNRELLNPMDGGQLMRVELPRSALMSFGLPMDMERAAERIKADVLVGNDGLARAIRFVR